MKLINLTPHQVNIVTQSGEVVGIPPEPTPARLEQEPPKFAEIVNDIAVYEARKLGRPVGLPAPEAGVYYITSLAVATAANRPDVLALGTGPNDSPVRKDGQIVAVTRLVRYIE